MSYLALKSPMCQICLEHVSLTSHLLVSITMLFLLNEKKPTIHRYTTKEEWILDFDLVQFNECLICSNWVHSHRNGYVILILIIISFIYITYLPSSLFL